MLFPDKKATSGVGFFGFMAKPSLIDSTTFINDAEFANKNLAQGFFTRFTSGRENAAEYLILPRYAPSTLNVSMVKNGKTASKIFVQYDNLEPEVIYYHPELATKNPINSSILGLVGAAESNPIAPTMRGAFGATNMPLYVVDSKEIPMPANTKKVSIWTEGAGSADIALSYKASKNFKLSEADYVAYMDTLKNEDKVSLFLSGLGKNAATPDDKTKSELNNHWRDFYKRINLMAERFTKYSSAKGDSELAIWPESDLKKHMQLAESLFEKKDWVSVIEELSLVIQHGYNNPEIYRAAFITRAKAIAAQGEVYSVEEQLKGAALYSKDSKLQLEAAELLAQIYKNNDQDNALQSLYAAQFMNNPSKDTVNNFSRALLDNGNSRQALEMALLLPEKDRDFAIITEAAYQESLWPLFDDSVQRLQKKQRELWKGYKAQKQGLYTTAISHWNSAGNAGDKLSDLLYQGMKLVHKIPDAAKDTKLEKQLQQNWSAWLNSLPGGGYWRPFIYGDMSAKESLRLKDKNADLSDVYFRISPNQPLVINASGNQKIRFEVRGLFNSAKRQQRDEWVHVKSDKNDGQHYLMAKNEPDLAYVVEGHKEIFAGGGRNFNYKTEDGERLEITTENNDAIVRVQVFVKKLPLAILPEVQMPLAVMTQKQEITATNADFISDCGTENVLINSQRVEWEKLWYAASLVRAQNFASASDDNESSALELENLAWLGKSTDQHKFALLEKIHNAKERSPNSKYLSELEQYFEKNYDWKQLKNPVDSAGIQSFKGEGWSPTSPNLRVHKALLGADNKFHGVVHGSDEFNLYIQKKNAAEQQVTLKSYSTPYTKAYPATIIYKLGAGEPEKISVPSDGEITMNLKLEAGANNISFKFAEPLPDQFVDISVASVDVENSTSYFVASDFRPFKIYAKEPMLLRIHEYDKDKNMQVYYRYIEENSGEVNIVPRADSNAETIQVFSLEKSKNGPTIWASLENDQPLSFVDKFVDNIAMPLPNLPNIKLDEEAVNLDKGTWAAYFAVENATGLDEENGADSDLFAETGVQYRYHSRELNSYFRTDIFGRNHESGSPTLGIRQWWDWYPANSPWNFELAGDFFAQDDEWSGLIKAEIGRADKFGEKFVNHFAVKALERVLSLDNVPTGSDFVDLDVFTRYKRDHMRQMIIANEFAYKPTPYSEIYIEPSVTSNEDLSADKLLVKMGYKQLVGDVVTDASIGWRRNFKDYDRETEKDTMQLGLNMNWQPEAKNKRNWNFSTRNVYDTEDGDLSTLFSVNVAFHDDRLKRNYRPAEIDFPDVRKTKTYVGKAAE